MSCTGALRIPHILRHIIETVEPDRCTLSCPAENSVATISAAGSSCDRQLTTFQIKKVPCGEKNSHREVTVLTHK